MVTAPRALLTRKTTRRVCRQRLAKKCRAVRASPHQHLDHVEALAEAEAARVLGIGGGIGGLVGHGSGRPQRQQHEAGDEDVQDGQR